MVKEKPSRFDFMSQHHLVYRGGLLTYNEDKIPGPFRTPDYCSAVWSGGVVGAYNPDSDPNRQSMLAAYKFMREMGTVAVIAQKVITDIATVVPDSFPNALDVRRDSIRQLADYIAAKEDIRILPEAVDRTPLSEDFFSIARGWDEKERYVIERPNGNFIYTSDPVVQAAKATFRYAQENAWTTDESAEYLQEVLRQYESG